MDLANSGQFVLPQIINIETVEAIKAELQSFLGSKKQNLILDASQVENITTPGLQLIVSLEKTLSAAGNIMLVKSESEPFSVAVKDAGLRNLFKGEII